MKKFVKTLIAAAIIISILSAIGKSGGSTSSSAAPAAADRTAQVTAPPPTDVPVLKVNATQLAGEYDANKIAAEAYYRGRIIQTSGIAQDVNQDIMGSYYVSLKPAGYDGWTSIQCFVSGPSDVMSVIKGNAVSVRGRVDDMTLGIIPLKDCTVLG